MKYLLALVFCLPLLASAQTPVITSGKYIVHGGGTAKELNNQADAKKYAARRWEECGKCEVVIDQPPIRYAGAQSSSSASRSSKADAATLQFGRPLQYVNGQPLAESTIKQYWLTRELNGTIKKESIKPTGDIILYPTTAPLPGEKWFLVTEINEPEPNTYSSAAPVQF